MTDYKQRVQKGAALLDERSPGWLDRVNVRNLDLGSCFDCVLGQLGGTYKDETRRLGMNHEDSIEYGFNVPSLDDLREERLQYEALTDEWRKYIAAARTKVAS